MRQLLFFSNNKNKIIEIKKIFKKFNLEILTLNDLNIRKDWKYIEPNELENIWSEADSTRPIGHINNVYIIFS